MGVGHGRAGARGRPLGSGSTPSASPCARRTFSEPLICGSTAFQWIHPSSSSRRHPTEHILAADGGSATAARAAGNKRGGATTSREIPRTRDRRARRPQARSAPPKRLWRLRSVRASASCWPRGRACGGGAGRSSLHGPASARDGRTGQSGCDGRHRRRRLRGCSHNGRPHAEMRDPPSASSAAAGVTGTPPASAAPPGGTRAAVASTLKVASGTARCWCCRRHSPSVRKRR